MKAIISFSILACAALLPLSSAHALNCTLRIVETLQFTGNSITTLTVLYTGTCDDGNVQNWGIRGSDDRKSVLADYGRSKGLRLIGGCPTRSLEPNPLAVVVPYESICKFGP